MKQCICRPLGAARTKKPRPRGGVLLAVADSAWHLVCGTRRGVSSQRRRSSFILRGSPATFRSNGGKGTAAATIPQQDAGGDGNSVEARLRVERRWSIPGARESRLRERYQHIPLEPTVLRCYGRRREGNRGPRCIPHRDVPYQVQRRRRDGAGGGRVWQALCRIPAERLR